MTPLMMLALTLPPSLAFVIERWMAGREAQARKLAAEESEALRRLENDGLSYAANLTVHASELKRLNEQLTILADRR